MKYLPVDVYTLLGVFSSNVKTINVLDICTKLKTSDNNSIRTTLTHLQNFHGCVQSIANDQIIKTTKL